MDSTKFEIDIKTSFIPSIGKFKRIRNLIMTFLLLILVIVIFVPLRIINFIIYRLPKKIYNKISGIKKEVPDVEIEDEIDVWRTLYLTKEIKIESILINVDEGIDDKEMEDVQVLKLRTFPFIKGLENEYFDTETYVFNKCLFLIRINKNIKVRESELITVDLKDFTISVLKVLDENYWITFDLISNDTLLIKGESGNKIIELTVTRKE